MSLGEAVLLDEMGDDPVECFLFGHDCLAVRILKSSSVVSRAETPQKSTPEDSTTTELSQASWGLGFGSSPHTSTRRTYAGRPLGSVNFMKSSRHDGSPKETR